MKTMKLFSMAAVALMMAACSNNDDNEIQQNTQQPGTMHFTATIAAPSGDATTRTVYTEDGTTINVKWKVGDKIALVHNGVVDEAEVKTVDDVTGKATIEANITGSPANDDVVTLAYPANAVYDADPYETLPFTPNPTTFDKVKNQDGTLEFIQNNLDFRMGTGKLAVSGSDVSLKGSVSVSSLICIWKLTLQDESSNALSATKLTFKNDTYTQAKATSAAKSEYYLCVVPSFIPYPSGTFSFEATVGGYTYTFSKTGLSLAAGNYYQSTVTMTKSDLLSGVFSVSSTKKVYFSKGNLRYASSKWSFFNNQYDYYTSYNADAWDKFGWSTSKTTYGMNTSTSSSTYSGDFADWGNNSELQSALGTGWRTLTSEEWSYLFNTRSASTVGGTSNGRYAKARVNNVQGVILFPDTYTPPAGVTDPTGVNTTGNTGWNGNSYTVADWTKMESAGCVFLPAAGYRTSSSVSFDGTIGFYWSATSYGSNNAYDVNFNSGDLNPANENTTRYYGFSVRLVRE